MLCFNYDITGTYVKQLSYFVNILLKIEILKEVLALIGCLNPEYLFNNGRSYYVKLDS